MKICTKGVWDETIPGIKFDNEGVSNFCHLQEQMMADYPRGEIGLKEWQSIVASIKKAGKNEKYDCVIGVSGGVDSSYLLYIAKQYGLRPLALNLDNGFNSKIAVQNIYNVTKQLDIDLETYVIDYEEIKDLLKSYMKSGIPWIDAPTDLAIKAIMYKIATQEGIKYIIRGNDFRSEGKQPKEWTYSDTKQLKYFHQNFGTNIRLKTYPFLPLVNMVYYGFINKIKDVRPFYYLEYNKQEAKKLLETEFGWKDYGGHHHENLFTKFSMAYWLPIKYGIDKRKINLSAQVLSNAISREDALIQISQPFAPSNELDDLREYIIKKLDFTQAEFNSVIKSPNKSAFDYPSNYQLIFGLVKYFSPIIKKLFAFQPMSITAKKFIDDEK